ncbi:hypothetical protein AAZX31_04G160700 [Glycine max]
MQSLKSKKQTQQCWCANSTFLDLLLGTLYCFASVKLTSPPHAWKFLHTALSLNIYTLMLAVLHTRNEIKREGARHRN